MKSIISSSFSTVTYYATQMLKRQDKGVRILCYHRVNDFTHNYITVSPERFESQIKYLSEKGYSSISLDELFAGQKKSKSIVITFDDGYLDNFQNAYPILKKYGFTATIFLIAGKIGEKDYLSKEDILKMIRDGFQFGSHTVNHSNLRKISSDEKWNEIKNSKTKLENMLGMTIKFFCYPFGEYDKESARFVQKAGYRGACSNEPGGNEVLRAFQLQRTEIAEADSDFRLKKKISGSYDVIHRALHLLRGRP